MDELEYLSKVCVNIIKAQNVSKQDAIMVCAKMIEMFSSVEQKENVVNELKEPVKEKVEKIIEESPIIAPAGEDCICDSCRKAVYKRIKPVKETMKLSEFITCFSPVGHNKQLPDKINVQNLDGHMSTDCPVCGGRQSLWLIGHGHWEEGIID